MKPTFARAIVMFGLILAMNCILPYATYAARQPNIVILLADDLGYGELGCQGNTQVPTPVIDAIAKAGVRFTNGYVTAPNCSPSRAGLITGRIPMRFGYEFNPIGANNEDPSFGLPASELTLAEHLHDGGYTTGLFGKWHLGGTARYHPQRHGFDEFFGFLHEGHFFVPPPYDGVTTMLRRRTLPGNEKGRWVAADGRTIYSTHMGHNEPPYDANNPILRGGQPVVEQEYLTNAIAREAVDFIDRNSDRPFLLYVTFNAVHSPLQGSDEAMQRFSHIEDLHRRIFAAMLWDLDQGVGRIMDKLRQEELEKNTLIFFLSDNGGPTRELTSSNAPLRGEKGQMYEGAVRVPMMVQWKSRLPEGVVYELPVSSLDIFPTACAASGLQTPGNLDGIDLLPFLTGANRNAPHPVLFWRQGVKTALRLGNWKLVQMSNAGGIDHWELYDLKNDLGETRDLAVAQPEKLQELLRIWQQLDGEMAEPLF